MDVAKALSGSKGPPQEVSANQLVLRLKDIGTVSEILPFPRTGPDGKPVFEYRMCVLSQTKIDSCLIEAERYTRKKFKNEADPKDAGAKEIRLEAWDEVYNNGKIVELLFQAMRMVEGAEKGKQSRHLFDFPDQIRDLLSADEIATLFHAYQSVQFKFGPLWRMLSEEEVDSWVDRLVEGLGSDPFSHLERGQLVQLVSSMALRLHNWRTDTGLSGGPAESGATSILESDSQEVSE